MRAVSIAESIADSLVICVMSYLCYELSIL